MQEEQKTMWYHHLKSYSGERIIRLAEKFPDLHRTAFFPSLGEVKGYLDDLRPRPEHQEYPALTMKDLDKCATTSVGRTELAKIYALLGVKPLADSILNSEEV
jgi:hypothetical protein